MFKPALQMDFLEVVHEVKVVEVMKVVAVKVDMTAKVEAKVEVVIHLITKTLHTIVAKRKDILLTTVRSQP